MKSKFSFGFLKLTAVLSVLCLFLIVLYALADIKPYISSGPHGKFGLLDFEKGIPVSVTFSGGEIQDSTFYLQSPNGSCYYNSGAPAGLRIPLTGLVHSDTVTVRYNLVSEEKIDDKSRITGGRLEKGILYVSNSKTGWRLLLVLPMILFFALAAFTAWQLSLLRDAIVAGKAFNDNNYRRIRNVGWGIITYELILLALQISIGWWWTNIDFYSTIPGYHVPFNLEAAPSYDFNLYWLIGGGLLLTFARAFKKGIQLQREQDLTI